MSFDVRSAHAATGVTFGGAGTSKPSGVKMRTATPLPSSTAVPDHVKTSGPASLHTAWRPFFAICIA